MGARAARLRAEEERARRAEPVGEECQAALATSTHGRKVVAFFDHLGCSNRSEFDQEEVQLHRKKCETVYFSNPIAAHMAKLITGPEIFELVAIVMILSSWVKHHKKRSGAMVRGEE